MRNYRNFINGKFVASSGTNRIEATNPSTGQTICSVPDSSQADVDAAVAAAEAAQSGWGKRPAIERAKALRAIAARIREHAEPLARLITEEQGKVLGLARVEVAFTADYLDGEIPTISVRLQEVFGLHVTPSVAAGRLPLLLKLLSPAHRPVQITRDLVSFWERGYHDVKKDLKGRYPKHYWPEDPYTAEPTRRRRPRPA